jgi:hypothetical protein
MVGSKSKLAQVTTQYKFGQRNMCVYKHTMESIICTTMCLLAYTCIQGNLVKIQTLTHRNLVGRSMMATHPVLSPSSILPPPPSH